MSSYSHQCKRVHREVGGDYEISWAVRGCGRRTKVTDRAGAERFCEKWGVPLPEERRR